MGIRRVFASIAVTSLLVGGMVGGMAPAAQAVPAGCNAGQLCMYTGTLFGGNYGQVTGGNNYWGQLNCSGPGCLQANPPGTWNDVMSSVANNKAGYLAEVSQDTWNQGFGHSMCIQYGHQVTDLGNYTGLNNAVSSNNWTQADPAGCYWTI